jgi:hypothetical protein
MKCPKCNYISFDFNQACPRCNKDISLEQEKLNIPAFKPDPPSLLNALLGDEAQTETPLSGSAVQTSRHEHRLNNEDTIRLSEPFLDDSQEIDLGSGLQELREGVGLEGIFEEPGQGVDVGFLQDASAAEQELRPPVKPEIAGTICLEEAEVFPGQEPEKEESPGEISLDLEEITLDFDEHAETVQGTGQEDNGLEFDLGDFSLEDAGVETSQGAAGDRGEQTPEDGNLLMPSEFEETDEITLSLDDLKVNETGELEIGRLLSDINEKREPIKLDDSGPNPENQPALEGEDDLSLLLGDDGRDIPAASDNVESLDLENLDLELDLEVPERK